jgi:2-hydroxy-4-carboxymuconate semialdehyde hemiacetal dehydrogenase
LSGLRFGLLGYGAIAAEHAKALEQLDCELVAVAGPTLGSAEAFAAEHGVARAGTDVAAVIAAGDVDAILVASPNAVHVDQAIAALEAGKHVLCEVPLAMSGADAARVAAAPGTLMVCHTQRFWRPVAELRARVEQGTLHPLHVVSRTLMSRRENVGWTGRRRSWVDSVVWHHGSHAVDTALYLIGDDVEHVGAAGGRPHPETGGVMDVCITIRTRSGALASLVLSYNALLAANDLVVIGEEELVAIDATSSAAMQDAAILAQNRAFVEAIAAGRQPEPSAASVARVYEVLQRVEDQLG